MLLYLINFTSIQVVEETGEPDSSISLNKEVSSAFNGFKEQSREFDPLNQEQTNQVFIYHLILF